MRLIKITLLTGVITVGGCANQSQILDGLGGIAGQAIGQSSGPLSVADISAGLKQALTVSSTAVVSQLGQQGGYENDPLIHIPLPTALVKAKDIAGKIGLQGTFDSLEGRLNAAAEQAAPQARTILVNSIRQLTLEDARGILQGPDDAATQFFKRTSADQLRNAMRPIVDNSLSQVGAVRGYRQLLSSYQAIPFAPPVEADLTTHVLNKGLDGIWFYMAQEEKAIRTNPVKRSTELLQRVFGSISR